MVRARAVRHLAVLVSIGAVSLAPLPAAALADNSTSAGDQQYVDPLSGSSAPAASAPSSSGSGSGSSSSSSSATSAAPAASPAASSGVALASSPAATTPAAASGSTGTTSSGRTLPFTGYDGGLAIALGSGLVAGGVLLRRRLAAAEH